MRTDDPANSRLELTAQLSISVLPNHSIQEDLSRSPVLATQ